MSWVRLDDAIFEDDWFVTVLTVTERYAWLALICYAGRTSGVIRTHDCGIIAGRIWSDKETVNSLLAKALKAKKIAPNYDDMTIEICNFRKYNPDPTSTERQRKHRQNASSQDVTVTDRDVTDVTPTVTVTDTDTITNSNPIIPPTPLADCDEFVQKWNAEIVPVIRNAKRVNKLSGRRFLALQNRLRDPTFTIPNIRDALQANTLLHEWDHIDLNWLLGFKPSEPNLPDTDENWTRLYNRELVKHDHTTRTHRSANGIGGRRQPDADAPTTDYQRRLLEQRAAKASAAVDDSR